MLRHLLLIARLTVAVTVAEEFSCKTSPGESPFSFDHDSIEHYLNPRLFEDPAVMEEAGRGLPAGDLLVLRNAFVPEFAEAMYQDLLEADFRLIEGYNPDGFAYHHHNVDDLNEASMFSPFLKKVHAMFGSEETKSFMTELSGRDCQGRTFIGSASHYEPGDHSLPHADYIGCRTVSYVWRLTKNWRPEWGGALYWNEGKNPKDAFLHASFNTLVLFSVSPKSTHFVTSVSRHATEERLAFNGWWCSKHWAPTLDTNITEVFVKQGRVFSADDMAAFWNLVQEARKMDPSQSAPHNPNPNLLADL